MDASRRCGVYNAHYRNNDSNFERYNARLLCFVRNYFLESLFACCFVAVAAFPAAAGVAQAAAAAAAAAAAHAAAADANAAATSVV